MKVSNTFFCFICLCLFMVSCKSDNNTVPSIAGETTDMYDGLRIYLKKSSADGSQVYIDTAIIVDNKFDFGFLEPFPTSEQLTLEMDTAPGIFNFVSENEGIYIKASKDSLMYSEIEGGVDNDLFSKYRKMRLEHGIRVQKFQQSRNLASENGTVEKVDALNSDWQEKEAAFKDAMKELITENPNRIVAPIALEFLLGYKYVDEVETRSLYNKLGDQVKQNDLSTVIDERLKKMEVTAIGNKAPYFEGKSPDGNIIKLPEILGKVTLVDFWASWCGPCRVENPNIVAAYNKYHKKGFNIISVSLDQPDAQEAWIAAIENDQMDWNHISRLAYWKDPIAAQYNVTAIPASFLLDENGVIIAKDLRGDALTKKLAQLLD